MAGGVCSEDELSTEILIVGAGFGGIGAAVALLEADCHDFIIVDKNSGIGGVWHTNTYPGVAVDVPAVFYSFSFAPPRRWTRFFPPGAEVRDYATQVVDDYGLRSRIRLKTEVTGAQWDEDRHLWRVHTAAGQPIVCRHLILGIGEFAVPKLPAIPGFDAYGGLVVHTASWDHTLDYRGKRIAVIGTGASALQLIPELGDIARTLTVYQRRPIWVAPKPDFAIPTRVAQLFSQLPVLRKCVRALIAAQVDIAITGIGVFHGRVPFVIPAMQRLGGFVYRRWLGDRVLAEQLTPRYAPYCKRPAISNRYLSTFRRRHVELVTDPIRELTVDGVVTHDGTHRKADILVCATGFDVMGDSTPPFAICGRGGQDLRTFWRENRFQAYQGVTVPAFPNLFHITGPYAYPGGSAIAMIECTSRHAARAIAAAKRRGATSVEVKGEPHDRYWKKCLQRAQRTIWLSPLCEGSQTYVVDKHGDPSFIRPSLHWEMWWGNRHFPFSDYRFATASRGRGQ